MNRYLKIFVIYLTLFLVGCTVKQVSKKDVITFYTYCGYPILIKGYFSGQSFKIAIVYKQGMKPHTERIDNPSLKSVIGLLGSQTDWRNRFKTCKRMRLVCKVENRIDSDCIRLTDLSRGVI